MKITLKELTDKIAATDYIQDLTTTKYADFNKSKSNIQKQASKMVTEMATALKHNSLAQIQLAVTGQRPFTFALESNIINLPYHNYKRVANFFEEEKEYPVQVYFETSSDYVNVSHFRIDLLATEDEINKDPAAVTDKLVAAMQEKIDTIRNYKKAAKTSKSK